MSLLHRLTSPRTIYHERSVAERVATARTKMNKVFGFINANGSPHSIEPAAYILRYLVDFTEDCVEHIKDIDSLAAKSLHEYQEMTRLEARCHSFCQAAERVTSALSNVISPLPLSSPATSAIILLQDRPTWPLLDTSEALPNHIGMDLAGIVLEYAHSANAEETLTHNRSLSNTYSKKFMSNKEQDGKTLVESIRIATCTSINADTAAATTTKEYSNNFVHVSVRAHARHAATHLAMARMYYHLWQTCDEGPVRAYAFVGTIWCAWQTSTDAVNAHTEIDKFKINWK